MWRPTAPQFLKLIAGLWIFGTGEGLLVHSALGNSPWVVLSEGVSEHTPLAVGAATVVISFFVLLCWIPLRQLPGLGTVANAIVIGIAIDVMLPIYPDTGFVGDVAWVFVGIGLVAVGSGLYLTTRLGPGPRDGLMTGLHRRTGRSLRLVRTGIEASALTAGFLLGGTVGFGTLAFALLIGPGVQAAVGIVDRGDERPL
ncbi:MAG: hypothetical protein H0V29_02810 [Thermoleophilaceae bacterium]|nr:hypothetical protein [Thermoleophilaceae bacterium]